MNSNEPECLLEARSPNGNVLAVAEQDANTCYFYLHAERAAHFGMKSCWVRNLSPAPDKLDASAMKKGLPPMLPREFCRHPAGAAPMKSSDLSVVWAEEGDAAALRENEQFVAIIPSWSGMEGFNGYARDCLGNSPLCWELGGPETNAQFARYEKAAQCWNDWKDNKTLWPDFQVRMMEAIERQVGKHSKYYAIDGNGWPPKALLRIQQNDSTLLVTIGMSLQPQPMVELRHEDAAPHRRIELGISLDASLPDSVITQIASYVGGQTGYPWSAFTFLGEGHTIPADAFKDVSEANFPFGLLQRRPVSEARIDLPAFREDPVNCLWLTPISERERKFAQKKGSIYLEQKLHENGFDWRHRFKREEVVGRFLW